MDPKIVKKTQDTLGKIIKKPPLTEKLLGKPPFRFLHDVVTSVIKTTGFMKGLYPDSDMNSENVKEKESKIAFLQKAIDMVGAAGCGVSAKPAKIVAGHEPEKTNEFLQALAAAVNANVDNDECVKKALTGGGGGGGESKRERSEHKEEKKDKERTRSASRKKDEDKRKKEDKEKSHDREKDREKRHRDRDGEDKDKDKEKHRDRREKSRDREDRHKDRDKDRERRKKTAENTPKEQDTKAASVNSTGTSLQKPQGTPSSKAKLSKAGLHKSPDKSKTAVGARISPQKSTPHSNPSSYGSNRLKKPAGSNSDQQRNQKDAHGPNHPTPSNPSKDQDSPKNTNLHLAKQASRSSVIKRADSKAKLAVISSPRPAQGAQSGEPQLPSPALSSAGTAPDTKETDKTAAKVGSSSGRKGQGDAGVAESDLVTTPHDPPSPSVGSRKSSFPSTPSGKQVIQMSGSADARNAASTRPVDSSSKQTAVLPSATAPHQDRTAREQTRKHPVEGGVVDDGNLREKRRTQANADDKKGVRGDDNKRGVKSDGARDSKRGEDDDRDGDMNPREATREKKAGGGGQQRSVTEARRDRDAREKAQRAATEADKGAQPAVAGGKDRLEKSVAAAKPGGAEAGETEARAVAINAKASLSHLHIPCESRILLCASNGSLGPDAEKEVEEKENESPEQNGEKDSSQDAPSRLQRPTSAKGSRRRRQGREARDDDDEDLQHRESHEPAISEHDLPPQITNARRMARPPSARPAPPRPKQDGVEAEPSMRLGTGAPTSLIIDDGKQSDDEEETFMVEGPAAPPPPPEAAPAQGDAEDDAEHGALVKKMLESKKEAEQQQPTKKTEIERPALSDAQRRKQRELVAKEIERLQTSIQSLTRSANPLGKIMDYVQEDMDSMQKELDRWRSDNKEHSLELRRERNVTDKAIEPLKAQLADMDRAIVDQLDLIATSKANIIRNDQRIHKMLHSIARS